MQCGERGALAAAENTIRVNLHNAMHAVALLASATVENRSNSFSRNQSAIEKVATTSGQRLVHMYICIRFNCAISTWQIFENRGKISEEKQANVFER